MDPSPAVDSACPPITERLKKLRPKAVLQVAARSGHHVPELYARRCRRGALRPAPGYRRAVAGS
eukprot:6094494-Prymnesium_polylepis.1